MINFISQSIWPQFSISIMLLLVLIGVYWSSLVLKIARNWIPEIIVFFQCLVMYSPLTLYIIIHKPPRENFNQWIIIFLSSCFISTNLSSCRDCISTNLSSFPEMLFRKCGCLVGPENRIFRKLIFVDWKKKRLWLRKWISVPIFTSNEFRRERESESAREKHARTSPHRSHAPSSSPRRSQAPAPSIAIRDRNLAFAPIMIGAVLCEIAIDASRDHAVDRDLAFAPIVIGAVLRDIAPSIAISPSRRSRSREAARCFARSRSTARSSDWSSRSTAPSNPVERQSGFCPCFLGLSFPCSTFQTPENIFRKIFWNTTKHIKTFSFPENKIFSKNAFTRTKHSLRYTLHPTFNNTVK